MVVKILSSNPAALKKRGRKQLSILLNISIIVDFSNMYLSICQSSEISALKTKLSSDGLLNWQLETKESEMADETPHNQNSGACHKSF